jgi:hypothetical protein
MNNEKERLIDRLRFERDSFEQILARLSEDQMVQLQITDQWTVKDVLAHITAWENELLRWLEKATNGQSPDLPAPGEWVQFIEQFNNKAYLDNRDRPLEDVVLNYKQAFDRVIFELRALPKNPDDDYWSVWLGGRPPWDLFATYHEHYSEHRKQIQSRIAID